MIDVIVKPTKKLLIRICGLLLIGLFLGSGPQAAEIKPAPLTRSAGQPLELKVPYETLLALAKIESDPETAAPDTTPQQSRQQPLLLTELVRQVVADNQQVQMQKTDWMIKQAEADRTRAIFEPELTTSLELESNSQRNSVEESLGQGLARTYSERNWNYDASVQALAPTGGKLKLGYNFNQLSDSLTHSLTDEEKEYQMFLGVNLTQPLLKNAGQKTTRAGIMSADLESSAAFQEYRLKMMQRVSKVSVDYWDYYQVEEKLQLRIDSYRIAKQILVDNQERHRTGKMAETEVLEAIIGVHTRKTLLSETAHNQLEIANRLRSLLSLTGSTADRINTLEKQDQPPQQRKKPATTQTTVKRLKQKLLIDDTTAAKFDRSENGLTAVMEQELDKLATTLAGKQNLSLKIVGHTDSHMLTPATAKIYGDNFGLGQARANNTAKYLAAQLGINKAHYTTGTGGPFKPVANNDTAAGRAKNRRVEIFVSYDQLVAVNPVKKLNSAISPAEITSLRLPRPLNLALTEPKSLAQRNLNSDEIIKTAFKLRPEYLAARTKLEQSKIKISFAKNQRWPELDLLASYGLNGLDFNTGDSWQQIEKGDYSSWSVGLQLRLPLLGGIDSRSRLRKSELEKRRQLMVLKDIEVELKNRIDTAIDNVKRTMEQLQYAEQIINIQKQLFDTELIKLRAGQSSSRLVLEKEDDYRSARETALVNTVKHQRALIEMELASGAILKKYGVDIMETER